MQKGKYLITGCAGFIGSHLVKKISDKYNLILVDDLSKGSLKNIEKKLRKKVIKKKIQDLNELKIKNLKGMSEMSHRVLTFFFKKRLLEYCREKFFFLLFFCHKNLKRRGTVLTLRTSDIQCHC